MAHLLARRCGGAGDEGDHRLAHAFGIFRRCFFHAAADLADDDDGVGAGVGIESFERIARGGAEHGIAADADECGLAEAGAGEIEADQRAETAAARDHADAAGLEHGWHEGRHDADKAFARCDQTGGVGTDNAGAVFGGGGMDRHHVLRRNMLGQHHEQLDAGLRRRHRGLLGHRRGDEADGDIAADRAHSVGGRGEDRHADMRLAGAFRVDTGHDIGAVADHLLGPERALLAGDAEYDDAVFFANDHCAACTAACTASSMKS